MGCVAYRDARRQLVLALRMYVKKGISGKWICWIYGVWRVLPLRMTIIVDSLAASA